MEVGPGKHNKHNDRLKLAEAATGGVPAMSSARRAPGEFEGDGPLCQVLGEMLVHLEHAHLVLAEHGLELLVSHDLALVGRVLKVVAS